MKNYIVFILAFFFLSSAIQAQKVHEICVDDKCDAGLHCVTLENGDKKCSECDQNELNGYTAIVKEKCKDWDKGIFGYRDLVSEFGTQNEISLVKLYFRKEACKNCYDARSKRDYECWNGGDRTHNEQKDEMKTAMNYLDGVINEKIRYHLAYNCDDGKFDDIQEDIDDNCKDLIPLFKKYGIFEEKEGSCSELEDLIDKCIDCREAWEDMMDNCFRNGASDKRTKEYNDVKDMEKISKETLEKRKSKNLCK